MDKDTSKLIGSGALLLATLGIACTIVQCEKDSEAISLTQKPYSQVIQDIESFNADKDLLDILSNMERSFRYIRLKCDKESPVCVRQEDLDDREIGAVKSALDYYNEVFKTINEDLMFKFIEDNESISSNSSIINFKHLKGEVSEGLRGRYIINSNSMDVGDGKFVKRATIELCHEKLKDCDDAYLYYVVLHELGHALGFGDVYTINEMKTTDVEDMETIMNVRNGIIGINQLFPNDYALLQALYSNEYTKHENYSDAVKVVNEKIKAYTDTFYECYAESIKNEELTKYNLKEEDMKYLKLEWERKDLKRGNLDFCIEIKDNKCLFTISDKDGNILEKDEPDLMYQNGVIFVRNAIVYDVNNFANFSHGTSAKFSFYIYKDKNGNVALGDNLIDGYYSLKVTQLKTR